MHFALTAQPAFAYAAPDMLPLALAALACVLLVNLLVLLGPGRVRGAALALLAAQVQVAPVVTMTADPVWCETTRRWRCPVTNRFCRAPV